MPSNATIDQVVNLYQKSKGLSKNDSRPLLSFMADRSIRSAKDLKNNDWTWTDVDKIAGQVWSTQRAREEEFWEFYRAMSQEESVGEGTIT